MATKIVKKITKNTTIRNGANYTFNGTVVRVIKQTNNGLFLVGIQRRLFGFARECELKKVS